MFSAQDSYYLQRYKYRSDLLYNEVNQVARG